MNATQKLACLIDVLHAGERLAAQVAWRQSQLAPVPWMRRALGVQAAQEHSHAAIAGIALRIVGTRVPASDTIAALRRQLNGDLDHGDLPASLQGLQGVVEHLGEALLEQLGRYPHPAGAMLHRLRRRVLAQERGHAVLGARCLQTLGACATDCEARQAYAVLGRATALQVATLLDDARLDAGAFWADVQSRLEQWHAGAAALRP